MQSSKLESPHKKGKSDRHEYWQRKCQGFETNPSAVSSALPRKWPPYANNTGTSGASVSPSIFPGSSQCRLRCLAVSARRVGRGDGRARTLGADRGGWIGASMSAAISSTSPLRGEIWMLNFDPTRGHEQSGIRPALILSVDIFNAGPAALVVVLPITSRSKGIRSHVTIQPPEGGLSVVSYIKCEDVRSVAKERLQRRMGAISAQTLMEVEDKLRILLGLQ